MNENKKNIGCSCDTRFEGDRKNSDEKFIAVKNDLNSMKEKKINNNMSKTKFIALSIIILIASVCLLVLGILLSINGNNYGQLLIYFSVGGFVVAVAIPYEKLVIQKELDKDE